jgi:hypothetical protein
MTQLLRLVDHEQKHKDDPDGGYPFTKSNGWHVAATFTFTSAINELLHLLSPS